MKRVSRASWLFALLTSALHAQTPSDAQLEEIEVTGARTTRALTDIAQGVSIIEIDDIDLNRQQFSLADTLGEAAGVFAQSGYNLSQDLRLSVRGFGATGAFGIRGVAVVVDGVPVTLPDGQTQVDAIDVESVTRVEVIRGPGSVAYGNAAGGIINVQTGARGRGQARLVAGAFGYQKVRASLSHADEDRQWGVRAGAWRWDGYRAHSASEHRSVAFWAETALTSSWRTRLSVDYLDAPESQDPGGINAAQAQLDPRSARDANVSQDAGEIVRQTRASVALIGEVAAGEATVRGWWLTRDFAALLPFTFGASIDLDRNYQGLQLQYSRAWSSPMGETTLTAGIDYADQGDKRRRFDNLMGSPGELRLDQKEDVSSRAAFVELQGSLTSSVRFSAGLRRDTVDFDVRDGLFDNGDQSGEVRFSETSYSTGLVWQPNEAWSAYASLGRSFATPTTTELASPSGAGFNGELRPQIADQLEVGLRGRWSRGLLQLSAYSMDIEGELIPFERDDQPGRTFFNNAGSTDRTGVEIEGSVQIQEKLTISMAWSRSLFEFNQFEDGGVSLAGNDTPGSPRSLGLARLQWSASNGATLQASVRHVGKFYADNSNRTRVPGYRVAIINASYPFSPGRWEGAWFAGVNNLFDEQYSDNIRVNAFGGRYFEPAPDRHFYAGIRLQLN